MMNIGLLIIRLVIGFYLLVTVHKNYLVGSAVMV